MLCFVMGVSIFSAWPGDWGFYLPYKLYGGVLTMFEELEAAQPADFPHPRQFSVDS